MKPFAAFFIAVTMQHVFVCEAQDRFAAVHPLQPGGVMITNLFLFNNNDGGISEINSIPAYQCENSIAPNVVIENYGTDTLTSATVKYDVDGGTPDFYYWQGQLLPTWRDTISLPQLTVAAGSHQLEILITEANGEADPNNNNNATFTFNVIGLSASVPYNANFNTLSLPDGFFVENSNGGPSWNVVSIYDQNNEVNCVRMPFYINDVSGDSDELFVKNFDLSNQPEAYLTFDLAYCYYSDSFYDELQVLASSDCGYSWLPVYDKWKDDLATAPANDVYFIPTSDQWRKEVVDLSGFAMLPDVLIKFEAISGHGNNLYIDNVSVNETVGIQDATESAGVLKLFPNPANDMLHVSFPSGASPAEKIFVYDAIGKQVLALPVSPTRQAISVSQLPAGFYRIIAIGNDAGVVSAPLIIQR